MPSLKPIIIVHISQTIIIVKYSYFSKTPQVKYVLDNYVNIIGILL